MCSSGAPSERRVVRGEAHQELRRSGAAHRLHGQIVGAEVHAVGSGGQGYVDAVVDEEECAVLTGEGQKPARLLEQRARVRGLVAELDGRRAGLQRRPHDVQQVARRGQAAIGDDDQPKIDAGPQPLPAHFTASAAAPVARCRALAAGPYRTRAKQSRVFHRRQRPRRIPPG